MDRCYNCSYLPIDVLRKISGKDDINLMEDFWEQREEALRECLEKEEVEETEVVSNYETSYMSKNDHTYTSHKYKSGTFPLSKNKKRRSFDSLKKVSPRVDKKFNFKLNKSLKTNSDSESVGSSGNGGSSGSTIYSAVKIDDTHDDSKLKKKIK